MSGAILILQICITRSIIMASSPELVRLLSNGWDFRRCKYNHGKELQLSVTRIHDREEWKSQLSSLKKSVTFPRTLLSSYIFGLWSHNWSHNVTIFFSFFSFSRSPILLTFLYSCLCIFSLVNNWNGFPKEDRKSILSSRVQCATSISLF